MTSVISAAIICEGRRVAAVSDMMTLELLIIFVVISPSELLITLSSSSSSVTSNIWPSNIEEAEGRVRCELEALSTSSSHRSTRRSAGRRWVPSR